MSPFFLSFTFKLLKMLQEITAELLDKCIRRKGASTGNLLNISPELEATVFELWVSNELRTGSILISTSSSISITPTSKQKRLVQRHIFELLLRKRWGCINKIRLGNWTIWHLFSSWQMFNWVSYTAMSKLHLINW